MKRRALLLSIISSFLLLTGCKSKENAGDNTNTSDDQTSEEVTTAHSQEWLNGKSFTVFTQNDFHGAIEEEGTSRMGVVKFESFFKRKGAEPNTIILDQGDTWQGSVYSNYNYGAMVNDVMSYARFDARTIGNHDFDWGVDKIKANTAREYDGYLMPTLAANVYDYNFQTKQFGNTQQEEIGKKSTIIEIENGIKIGVVGVIGSDQITSINSQFTQEIGFKPHIPVIKEEATYLRNQGCDFVICSIHTGQESVIGNNLKDYVDLVLCGHTHQKETYLEDDVLPYVQTAGYGTSYGEIHVEYTASERHISYDSKYCSTNLSEFNEVDSGIQAIVDRYNAQCDDAASEVLAKNVVGTFDSNLEGINLMCEAIMDRCIQEGYDDVIFSNCNYARHNLDSGDWTFADIYQAYPFDNSVIIAEMSGKEIYEHLRYNICKNPDFDGVINYTQKYKVAILDYLFFHTNSDREYDWYPEAQGQYINKLNLNYRMIMKEWLISKGCNTGSFVLNSDNFKNTVSKFKKDFTYQFPEYTVTFDLQGGSIEDVSQLVRTGTVVQYYSDLYPNPNPTKEDYVFGGWFLDNACTVSADGKNINQDRTLYAKWRAYTPPDNIILADEIDWSGTSCEIDVSNSLKVNLSWFRCVHNTQYGQIQINREGYFEIYAPTNYKFTNLYIEIFQTYDNLDFSAGGVDITEEGFTTQTNRSTYEFNPNASAVYIRSPNYTTYIYFIQIELTAI